jgi:hypothetical protein
VTGPLITMAAGAGAAIDRAWFPYGPQVTAAAVIAPANWART